MRNYYDESEKILLKLDEKVTHIIAKLKTLSGDNPEDIFFDNNEFLQLMNISKRTAQSWRDNGTIAYSQIGSKIYYRFSDILKLLNINYVPATHQFQKNDSTQQ